MSPYSSSIQPPLIFFTSLELHSLYSRLLAWLFYWNACDSFRCILVRGSLSFCICFCFSVWSPEIVQCYMLNLHASVLVSEHQPTVGNVRQDSACALSPRCGWKMPETSRTKLPCTIGHSGSGDTLWPTGKASRSGLLRSALSIHRSDSVPKLSLIA